MPMPMDPALMGPGAGTIPTDMDAWRNAITQAILARQGTMPGGANPQLAAASGAPGANPQWAAVPGTAGGGGYMRGLGAGGPGGTYAWGSGDPSDPTAGDTVGLGAGYAAAQ